MFNSEDIKDNYKLKKLLKVIVAWKAPPEREENPFLTPEEEEVNRCCGKFLLKMREVKTSFLILSFVQSAAKIRSLTEKPEDIVANFNVAQVTLSIIKFFMTSPELDQLHDLRLDLIRLLVRLFELAQKKDRKALRELIVTEIGTTECLVYILQFVFERSLFSIRSSFGIYNYKEEALYITMESLIVALLETHPSTEARLDFLADIIQLPPKAIDYFPMTILAYVLGQRGAPNSEQVCEAFLKLFLAHIQPKSTEKARLFFAFLDENKTKLTEKETIDCMNKTMEIVHLTKTLEAGVVKVLFGLANNMVHFSVRNVIDFISDRNKKSQVMDDLAKDLCELLLQIDFTCLAGLEVEVEALGPELEADSENVRLKANRLRLTDFVFQSFSALSHKGKRNFLDQALKFFQLPKIQGVGLSASILMYFLRSILEEAPSDLFEKTAELTMVIGLCFPTRFPERIERVVAEKFWALLSTKEGKLALFARFGFWASYLSAFLVKHPQNFLICVPFFLGLLFENPKLLPLGPYYKALTTLCNCCWNFSEFPFISIKSPQPVSRLLDTCRLDFLGDFPKFFFEGPFNSVVAYPFPADLSSGNSEAEYLNMACLAFNKLPKGNTWDKLLEELYLILDFEAQKDQPGPGFFGALDILYFLSHFSDSKYFQSSFVGKMDGILRKVLTQKSPSIPVSEIKVNHILKHVLIFSHCQHSSSQFLTPDVTKLLGAAVPATAALFRTILTLIYSRTDFTIYSKAQKATPGLTPESDIFVFDQSVYLQVDPGSKQVVICDLFSKKSFALSFAYDVNTPHLRDSIDHLLTDSVFSQELPNNLLGPAVRKAPRNMSTEVSINQIDSSEYKNVFKIGLLFVNGAGKDWNEVYLEQQAGQSPSFQQFFMGMVSECVLDGKSLVFESLFDVYRFHVGQLFDQSEVFEKRRFIGNSPILILFNDGHPNPLALPFLLTEFNVLVFLVSVLPSGFHRLTVSGVHADKVNFGSIEDCLFCKDEIIRVLMWGVMTAAKRVSQVIFHEEVYEQSLQRCFSNALLSRREAFQRLYESALDLPAASEPNSPQIP